MLRGVCACPPFLIFSPFLSLHTGWPAGGLDCGPNHSIFWGLGCSPPLAFIQCHMERTGQVVTISPSASVPVCVKGGRRTLASLPSQAL
jgi:hypothetical protein